MIFAQRGGYYINHKRFRRTDGSGCMRECFFCITPDIKVELYAIVKVDFSSDYSKKKESVEWLVKKPFKGAHPEKMPRDQLPLGKNIKKEKAKTVWDWAAVFLFESTCGGNQNSRDLEDALMQKDFLRIAKNVDISEWDGIRFNDIRLFDGVKNELAREAQYHAARHGVITVPHLSRPDLMMPKEKDIF